MPNHEGSPKSYEEKLFISHFSAWHYLCSIMSTEDPLEETIEINECSSRSSYESEVFKLGSFNFQIKFNFKKTKDRFVVNVKNLSDRTFGMIIITVVDQRDAKCSKKFIIKSDFGKNTYVVCRFKNLNYCEVSDFILYNTLQIRVRFEPKEKNANPIINPPIAPKPRFDSGQRAPRNYTRDIVKFAGLKNHQSLCYMNSLLQTLFNIPSFRRIIYGFDSGLANPENVKNVSKSGMAQLQFLFYNLEKSHSCSTTNALRRSFGWDENFSSQQNDSHEFFTLLLNRILEKFQISDKTGFNRLTSLIEIRTQKYFELEEENYFEDKGLPNSMFTLPLYVSGQDNVQDMIQNFLNGELIDVDVPNLGKRTCFFRERFTSLPNILFIHLQRYGLSPEGDVIKIEKSVNYQETIEIPLAKVDDGKPTQTVKYSLHGILCHSGSAGFGHYYAILRPEMEDNWFTFNDEYVSKTKKEYAMSNNSECYLLMYSNIDTEEADFTLVDAEKELSQETLKAAKENQPELSVINVITNRALVFNSKIGRRGYRCPEKENMIEVPVKIDSQILISKIKDLFNNDNNDFQIWILSEDQSCFKRMSLTNKKTIKIPSRCIFVEFATKDNPVTPEDKFLIFIKYFDPESAKITFLGTTSQPKENFNEESLFKLIKYPENKKEDQKYIVTHEFFEKKLEVTDGSILIYQADHPKQFKEEYLKEDGDNIVVSYYQSMGKNDGLYRTFYEAYNQCYNVALYLDNEPFDEIVTLRYPCRLDSMELRKFIAPVIAIEFDGFMHNMVLFFEYQKDCFATSIGGNIQNIFSLIDNDIRKHKMYVKVENGFSDDSHNELYRGVVFYYSENSYDVTNMFFVVERCDEVVKKVIENHQIPLKKEEDGFQQRISLVNHGRIERIVDVDTFVLGDMENGTLLRIDEVPAEQKGMDLETGAIIVTIDEGNLEDAEYRNSMSFYLPIVSGEELKDTKKRIQTICKVDDAKFARFRYTLNAGAPPSEPNERLPCLTDSLVISDLSKWKMLHLDIRRDMRAHYQQMRINTL